jgi:hypothetical protein
MANNGTNSGSQQRVTGVQLTSDGSLVGIGSQLLKSQQGDGYSPNDLPPLATITLTPEQIAALQAPSCQL